MLRQRFFQDSAGVVHETGGHYGASSRMACELDDNIYRRENLRSVNAPPTCLECVRAMSYTKWS